MTWLPYGAVDRKIRAVLKKMEQGATDELDRTLAALINEQKRVERAG